jgi:tetratricopeptide (TPR) repeat protein
MERVREAIELCLEVEGGGSDSLDFVGVRRIPMIAVALAVCLLLAGSPASAAGAYGHVDFANSGAASAQTDFLDGLALLHDFEYPAAAAAFRRAEAVDSGFAMAYWGEAMTFNHPIWMQQDLEAARAALNKLAPTTAQRGAKTKTDGEKGYLDAVEILYGDGSKEERDFRYEEAMAKLHERYPDDVDAAAFYGLSILGTAHAGRDVAIYMRAAGVLEEAWVNHRDHPGLVHYLIHSYDDPTHAPLGLRAARIYARIAPDAGHAQHMTSHIFLALGMWPQTVSANVAAIADVDRVRKAEGKSPLGCGHYPSWLGYAYLQLGQMDKAGSALASCRTALESEAAMDQSCHSMDPDESLSGAFANMRLRYLLDTGNWTGEIAGLALPKTAGPGARLDFAFARVMGEIMQRHPAAARQALGELEVVGQEVADIETKRGGSDPSYRVRPEIFLLEARALLAEQEGDLAGAERLLRQAVGLEEKLPIAFGPPTIDKPTHELLGEFLLRHGRKDEAHAEFERALALTPGRRLAEQGFEASSAGATSRGSR